MALSLLVRFLAVGIGWQRWLLMLPILFVSRAFVRGPEVVFCGCVVGGVGLVLLCCLLAGGVVPASFVLVGGVADALFAGVLS